MWWYHLICWLLSLVGVVFILVAHEHYSVDVVVAYFVTSRLFYWYHTMTNNQVNTLQCDAERNRLLQLHILSCNPQHPLPL